MSLGVDISEQCETRSSRICVGRSVLPMVDACILLHFCRVTPTNQVNVTGRCKRCFRSLVGWLVRSVILLLLRVAPLLPLICCSHKTTKPQQYNNNHGIGLIMTTLIITTNSNNNNNHRKRPGFDIPRVPSALLLQTTPCLLLSRLLVNAILAINYKDSNNDDDIGNHENDVTF